MPRECNENVATEQFMACNGHKALKYVTEFHAHLCMMFYNNNFPLTSVTWQRFAFVIVVPQAEHLYVAYKKFFRLLCAKLRHCAAMAQEIEVWVAAKIAGRKNSMWKIITLHI